MQYEDNSPSLHRQLPARHSIGFQYLRLGTLGRATATQSVYRPGVETKSRDENMVKAKVAKKTKSKLWSRIKSQVKASGKGGRPGQWSARKAQLATQKYKSAGGGYKGAKTSSNSLKKWTKEDWGTKSGKNSTQGKNATGERYLPKKKRDSLTKKEYAATSRKKREDTKKGKQFSKQPEKVAEKTSSSSKPSPKRSKEKSKKSKKKSSAK